MTIKSDQKLDVSGVVTPFSLALCKSTLGRMATGAVLEIRLQDQDTLQDLLLILNRSGDHVVAWEEKNDSYYLWVRRSPECQEPGDHGSL
jgi:TusA-related sulfurtransferase